ncbi:unnamed protein product [Schistosoma margrebowiei]|uniref:Uncharacterized protein n=1 Tax=Schistosoma margrebowiei TaxID=48269 RepID=A0A183MGL3_9TREM|nr:unnamed protein product [Schistosoma margrebowiei]
MQMKTTSVATASEAVRVNIHKGKSKILRFIIENTNPITLDRESLEQMKTFTCLDKIIEQRGSDENLKARIGKARTEFLCLKDIWNYKKLSVNVKVRNFNTNVMTVLLYGAETWRTTATIIKKVQVLRDNYLHKIRNIR